MTGTNPADVAAHILSLDHPLDLLDAPQVGTLADSYELVGLLDSVVEGLSATTLGEATSDDLRAIDDALHQLVGVATLDATPWRFMVGWLLIGHLERAAPETEALDCALLRSDQAAQLAALAPDARIVRFLPQLLGRDLATLLETAAAGGVATVFRRVFAPVIAANGFYGPYTDLKAAVLRLWLDLCGHQPALHGAASPADVACAFLASSGAQRDGIARSVLGNPTLRTHWLLFDLTHRHVGARRDAPDDVAEPSVGWRAPTWVAALLVVAALLLVALTVTTGWRVEDRERAAAAHLRDLVTAPFEAQISQE